LGHTQGVDELLRLRALASPWRPNEDEIHRPTPAKSIGGIREDTADDRQR
jgi:hypothetical protein